LQPFFVWECHPDGQGITNYEVEIAALGFASLAMTGYGGRFDKLRVNSLRITGDGGQTPEKGGPGFALATPRQAGASGGAEGKLKITM
jgi:hypothetical protein